MTDKFPMARKESTYSSRATHDLFGHTAHPDAAQPHEHEWRVTLIWIKEMNCKIGFIRDEADLDTSWGGRIRELNGKNLSELLDPLPATAENLALWLLYYWMPRLTAHWVNFELSGVRVRKCETHVAEFMQSSWARAAWEAAGGKVA